ncbi:unnamed protein product, partial [marine sediment metagenome]
DKISPYADFQKQDYKKSEELVQKLIQPTQRNSQKFSIPIFYVNPQNFSTFWSKKLRENGAILFKLWDRPISCIAKICEYTKYRRKHSK